MYKHWREWLTKESFQVWMEKNDASLFKRFEDFTPEEIEEMNRKDAEYEAKYRTEDEAAMNGKCAGCKEKCSWYHETVKELGL